MAEAGLLSSSLHHLPLSRAPLSAVIKYCTSILFQIELGYRTIMVNMFVIASQREFYLCQKKKVLNRLREQGEFSFREVSTNAESKIEQPHSLPSENPSELVCYHSRKHRIYCFVLSSKVNDDPSQPYALFRRRPWRLAMR